MCEAGSRVAELGFGRILDASEPDDSLAGMSLGPAAEVRVQQAVNFDSSCIRGLRVDIEPPKYSRGWQGVWASQYSAQSS